MIVRTFDTKVVQKLISNPILLRRSGSKTEKVFDPDLQRDLYYLLVIENDEIIGLILFHMQNAGCYQGHVNYLPSHWGERLEKHTKEAIAWMFENADCKKIFALVPSRYPEIKRHSKLSGMKEEGLLTDSYWIGDTVYSQTIMAISK